MTVGLGPVAIPVWMLIAAGLLVWMVLFIYSMNARAAVAQAFRTMPTGGHGIQPTALPLDGTDGSDPLRRASAAYRRLLVHTPGGATPALRRALWRYRIWAALNGAFAIASLFALIALTGADR